MSELAERSEGHERTLTRNGVSGDVALDHRSVEPPATAGSAIAPTAAPITGHADVDAVLDSLTNLDHLTPREQVSRYTEVHGALQETLRTIDAA